MTPDAFRDLALALPEAVEASHMGHADFRVGGAWGKAGSTIVRLEKANEEAVGAALEAAWRKRAPKRLTK